MNSTLKFHISSLLFASLIPGAHAFMPQAQSENTTQITAAQPAESVPVIQNTAPKHKMKASHAKAAPQASNTKTTSQASNAATTSNSAPAASTTNVSTSQTTPIVGSAPVTPIIQSESAPSANRLPLTQTVEVGADKSPVFSSPIQMEIIEERPLVTGQPTSFVVRLFNEQGPVTANQLAPAEHDRIRLTLIDPSLSQLLSLYPSVHDSKGHYKFNMTFNKAGKYEAVAEVMDKAGFVYMPNAYVNVPGPVDTIQKATHLAAGTLEPHQNVGGIHFSTTTTSKQIRANQLVILDITAKQPTGEFHKGLQTFMGQYAHLIGINEKKDILIHADPMMPKVKSAKDLAGPDVRFKLRFPEPGFYRLWAQFQIEGKQVVVPYDLEVLP